MDQGAAARMAGRFASNAKRDSLRFAEADKDGNNVLDWNEFLEMQPMSIRLQHSEKDIYEWFKSADVDGSGTVSINEFFMYTLQRVRIIASIRGPLCGLRLPQKRAGSFTILDTQVG